MKKIFHKAFVLFAALCCLFMSAQAQAQFTLNGAIANSSQADVNFQMKQISSNWDNWSDAARLFNSAGSMYAASTMLAAFGLQTLKNSFTSIEISYTDVSFAGSIYGPNLNSLAGVKFYMVSSKNDYFSDHGQSVTGMVDLTNSNLRASTTFNLTPESHYLYFVITSPHPYADDNNPIGTFSVSGINLTGPVTTVPEPSQALMLLLGAAFLLFMNTAKKFRDGGPHRGQFEAR